MNLKKEEDVSIRNIPLVEGETYHICCKSIADFEIFRDDRECSRMMDLMKYYKASNPPLRFSDCCSIENKKKVYTEHLRLRDYLISIIAFCIMPTHLHLVLKQLKEGGISAFMGKILNSYSKYFNIKTKRKGPLWESRFKNILVRTDEQLLHLTRYIHLNPVTANLVEKPENWKYSSYREYLGAEKIGEEICDFSEVLDIKPKLYQEFVESRIGYQRELAGIKSLYVE